MNNRGFTVLELLVAISVAVILLTIGIPSFMQIIAENRRVSYTADVFNTLNFARSEAISRNLSVIVCKSADGERCSPSGAWSDGWLVYANLEGDLGEDDFGNGEPDAGDVHLLSNQGLKGYTMTSPDYDSHVQYIPAGRAAPAGQFELCPANGKIEGRIVRINAAGRATTPTASTPDCPDQQ